MTSPDEFYLLKKKNISFIRLWAFDKWFIGSWLFVACGTEGLNIIFFPSPPSIKIDWSECYWNVRVLSLLYCHSLNYFHFCLLCPFCLYRIFVYQLAKCVLRDNIPGLFHQLTVDFHCLERPCWSLIPLHSSSLFSGRKLLEQCHSLNKNEFLDT